MANLIAAHHLAIEGIELIPSKGGVFEVWKDDQLIFSKKALGRHAHPDEIEKLIA